MCCFCLGCEMALLFPMRSRRIYTAVAPEVPLALSAFTVCMWVKPTAASSKTVLLSYGDRHNPFEIQLLLAHTSALITIGGEAHLVEARGVVKSEGTEDWTHLCGTWSSEQGLASLWADGKKVVTTTGVAEGHVLPDGGSFLLGQERSGCCLPNQGNEYRVPGFEAGFEPKLAFTGKMTGVNMWSRVLSGVEISQLALREGRGCGQRGNIVAWGVTEMVPHGGAQFVNWHIWGFGLSLASSSSSSLNVINFLANRKRASVNITGHLWNIFGVVIVVALSPLWCSPTPIFGHKHAAELDTVREWESIRVMNRFTI